MLLKAYVKTRVAMGAAKARLTGLGKDESGASMIEYALLAALISIAAIVMVTTVGTDVNTAFTKVATALPNA